MIFLLIFFNVLITIYPHPPDTRSEYQKTFDECTYNIHKNFISINPYRDECLALLDVLLDNGWSIVATTNDRSGLTSYVIQKENL